MSLKILLSDDNISFVEIIKQFFSETNAADTLITAYDGYEAVDAIVEHEPDVVIMDIFMPGLDGIGVLRKIKTLHLKKKPVIIIISAAGQSKIIQIALNLGAEFFMIKPVNLEELTCRIEELKSIKSQDEIRKLNPVNTSDSARLLENRIMDILDGLGVPSNLLGYKYLVSGILMLCSDLTLIYSITKHLYSDLAEQWNTTPQRVERSIRNAIETTWTRGNLNNISKTFDPDRFNQKIRPSNSEFMIKIINECLNQITKNG